MVAGCGGVLVPFAVMYRRVICIFPCEFRFSMGGDLFMFQVLARYSGFLVRASREFQVVRLTLYVSLYVVHVSLRP